MTDILFSCLVFIAVFGIVFFALQWWLAGQQKKRLFRFEQTQAQRHDALGSERLLKTVSQMVDPLGKLSMPSEGWENSSLQTQFVNAGWRSPSAPSFFLGMKTLLTFGLPLVVYFTLPEAKTQNNLLAILFFSAAIGVYLPNLILRQAIARRTKDLSDSFPDALDLLVITMEAGLSFDLALAKVASEIRIRSQTLSDELNMVLLEMRTGFTRERALRNLAMRTGVENIDALATLVIQAERYGTSVGDSLRIQSENFRLQRRLSAEEQAAKIGVKLLFPLIMFIMPALFIVLLGPAFLQISQNFLNQ